MNPKEFNWEESQQVTVTNPTKEDYLFKVHSKEYEVKAQEMAKMPGFIAWVYVYGLACKMAQETNVKKDDNGNKTSDFNRWNEEGFRKAYYEKLVVAADAVIERVEPQPVVEKVETEKLAATRQTKV